MHDEIPGWWRPYWAVVTILVTALLMIEDEYQRLIPALVACAAACFTLEYFSRRFRQ